MRDYLPKVMGSKLETSPASNDFKPSTVLSSVSSTMVSMGRCIDLDFDFDGVFGLS